MSVKSSISLTDQQDAFARRLVQDGRYPSVSAVMQHGLDLLRQQTEAQEADTQALLLLLDRRRAGPFISAPEMEERIEAMLARKRHEHGVAD